MRRAAWAVVLLAGCAAGRSAKLEGNYRLSEPGQDWKSVNAGSADYAWFNRGLGATIYSDSNCGKRFEDRSLPDLAKSLVTGIGTGPPTRDEQFTLDGRDAWVGVVPGQLDGIAVQLGVGVLKKDNCTYDVLYVATPARFDAGYDAFVAVLRSLQTGG
jgi:hypothetical protein